MQNNDNTNSNNDEPTTHSTTTTTPTLSSSSVGLSAHGYFFLSLDAAAQALQRLREQDPAQVQLPDEGMSNSSSSASNGEVSVSTTAKIISVPLGMALQQSLSHDATTIKQQEVINSKNNKNNNTSNNTNNNHLPTHHHLVVSLEGRNDAQRIEKEFLDRGGKNNLYNNQHNYRHQNNLNNDYEKNVNNNNNKKSPTPPQPSRWEQTDTIPLFYMEGLTVSNGKYEPRYFNQDDLLEEFTEQHPDTKLPPTQLVDLVDLYHTGTAAAVDEEEVTNLIFVPASETVQIGKELPNTSLLPKYNAQQIYLVDKLWQQKL